MMDRMAEKLGRFLRRLTSEERVSLLCSALAVDLEGVGMTIENAVELILMYQSTIGRSN